jgi:hypothetical protein
VSATPGSIARIRSSNRTGNYSASHCARRSRRRPAGISSIPRRISVLAHGSPVPFVQVGTPFFHGTPDCRNSCSRALSAFVSATACFESLPPVRWGFSPIEQILTVVGDNRVETKCAVHPLPVINSRSVRDRFCDLFFDRLHVEECTLLHRRELYEGLLAQAEYDTSKQQFQSAQASVNAAQAAMRHAQVDLDDCKVKSPLTGLVIDRKIELGSLVSPNSVGFLVGDTSKVKVVFGVPGSIVGNIHTGNEVAISTDALPHQSFKGTITKVGAAADPNSRVFDIEATIPNSGGRLRSE